MGVAEKESAMERKAADIMTSPVIYVMPETPVREIARVLLNHRISAVPVIGDSGRLMGIVSEGDLVRRTASEDGIRRCWWLDMFEKGGALGGDLRNYLDHHGLRAKDVMSSDVVTIEEDTPISAVAELLQLKGIKRVPVLHQGRMVGIVSRANLLAALAKMH